VNPSKPANRDPFFIGWRPVPPSYRRLLIPAAAGLILALVGIAALLGGGQRAPAGGTWDTSDRIALTGVVYAEPYAMLRVAADPPRTVLLLGDGKAGATDLVRPVDGRPVRVTGTLLRGEGFELLELDGGPEVIAMPEVEQFRLRRPDPRPGPEVLLSGEVVDSKCHLGAMRPGRGTGHRGCAALCLRGGVPPLFVAARPGGEARAYLMVGWTTPDLVHLVGRPVDLTVRTQRWDDVPVIRPADGPVWP
jgi:hypothetical protein